MRCVLNNSKVRHAHTHSQLNNSFIGSQHVERGERNERAPNRCSNRIRVLSKFTRSRNNNIQHSKELINLSFCFRFHFSRALHIRSVFTFHFSIVLSIFHVFSHFSLTNLLCSSLMHFSIEPFFSGALACASVHKQKLTHKTSAQNDVLR